MTETTFDKSPDIEGQIPPGPVIPFKLVTFPDTTKGQTFVLYDSLGNEISAGHPLSVSLSTPPAISTLTESSYSVTTSSTIALAANASRVGGYVQNISDTDMYISFGGTATTTTKTKLFSGASLPLTIGNLLYKGALTAIHGGTGTKTLAIVELT